jgi:hypothetical protein
MCKAIPKKMITFNQRINTSLIFSAKSKVKMTLSMINPDYFEEANEFLQWQHNFISEYVSYKIDGGLDFSAFMYYFPQSGEGLYKYFTFAHLKINYKHMSFDCIGSYVLDAYRIYVSNEVIVFRNIKTKQSEVFFFGEQPLFTKTNKKA